MKAEITAYEQPIITPEVMEHVGRHIVFNACIWCHKEHAKAKEHDGYVLATLNIPAAKLNAWFSSSVNNSFDRTEAEDYRDAGYEVLYRAIEHDPIEDVFAIASGEKSQAVIYWLELDQFFDKYVEALVEQASLPDSSIIVNHAAIQNTEEVTKEGLIAIPVLIREELAYTCSNYYSLEAFLRKLIGEPDNQGTDTNALWDFYESVTMYGEQHIEEWDIVKRTTHYISIESDG